MRKATRLRQFVELEQEGTELGEAFSAEFLRPRGLEIGNGLADHADRGAAARGEGDALGAEVIRIRSPLEVAEAFELAQQVVEGLLADAPPSG